MTYLKKIRKFLKSLFACECVLCNELGSPFASVRNVWSFRDEFNAHIENDRLDCAVQNIVGSWSGK